MKAIRYFYFLLLIAAMPAYGQAPDSASIFKLPIQLDPIVVKSGFDVNAFIRRVRTDTTFYKAFKSMRLVPYTSHNSIAIYDKKGQVAASFKSTTRQQRAGNCRTIQVAEQQMTGDYFKRNGQYNYYTAELFGYLFNVDKPGQVCNENDIVNGIAETRGKGPIEKSTYQLKQLIFNPGSKVGGVPLMGDRAAIFEPSESYKYDFKITQVLYEGNDCYLFRIMPKPEYQHKALYNELITWFLKSDYSIVARDYSLSFDTHVYDFDVKMKVRTRQINGKLYPTFVSYDGDWHILMKKRERVKFTVDITY